MEAVFILQACVRTLSEFLASQARRTALSAAYSDFPLFANEISQDLETAPEPFAIESRISSRDRQDERAIFVRKRGLVDNAGHPYRQHVGGANRGSDNPSPALNALVDEGAQPIGKLLGIVFRCFMAMKDGQRQEDAALMVDTAEASVGNRVDALLAAIVRMSAPADVGEKAGGVAETPLVGGFFQRRVGKELIRPPAKLPRVLD